jgi:hypothetical protein
MRKPHFYLLFGLLLSKNIYVFGAQISTDYDHSTNFFPRNPLPHLVPKVSDFP